MDTFDPDKQLWSQAQRGDDTAFERLRRNNTRIVRGRLRQYRPSISEDDLLDMEQRVWLAVHRGLERFRGESKFSTWVAGIAINIAKEWERQRKAELRKLEAVGADLLFQVPISPEEQGVRHLLLTQILAELPENQRIVIQLTVTMQLTDEETAQMLGEPLGTVKSRKKLGLKKLRDRLETEQGDYTSCSHRPHKG